MATIMEPEQTGAHNTQQVLEENIILLSPSFGYWQGMYKLDDSVEVTSHGETLEKGTITQPSAKLMTDTYPTDAYGVPYKKTLQKLASRLKNIKDKYSLPFPITGVRIVPKKYIDDMMDELYGLTLGTLRAQKKLHTEEIIKYQEWDPLTQFDEMGDSITQEECARRLSQARADVSRLTDEIGVAIGAGNLLASNNMPLFEASKGAEQSLAYQLHILAEDFCNRWDAIKQEIAVKNPQTYNQVSDRLPQTREAIRDKFHLDVVPVELAGNKPQKMTRETLAAHMTAHQNLLEESCQRRVNEAIEEMIRGPRQQLAQAMSNLKELIARNGRVTTASFRPVREAIAKIRVFDFVANDGLLNKITEMEGQLDITAPKDLINDAASAEGFSTALDAYAAEVEDELQAAADIDRFGRETRGIDL